MRIWPPPTRSPQLRAIEQTEIEPPDADRQGEADRERQPRLLGVHAADHHAQHRLAQDDDREQPQPFRKVGRVRRPAAEAGHGKQRRQQLRADGHQVEGPTPRLRHELLRSPGDRRHGEADHEKPREAARGGHADVRLQVEQHQQDARAELRAGEGCGVLVQSGLHVERGARQGEHQQQCEERLQDAAVVEPRGVGGVAGPHQEQRQVQRADLSQGVQVGMGHQVMGQPGDVDDEDQVEEQLQPGRRAALGRSAVNPAAVAQDFSHGYYRSGPCPRMSRSRPHATRG